MNKEEFKKWLSNFRKKIREQNKEFMKKIRETKEEFKKDKFYLCKRNKWKI